jgi:hypothetical protein
MSYDNCIINSENNIDYENYDMFVDIIQIATSYDNFLKQIYELTNLEEIEIFLKNNINELPILSQQRILNAIYHVYKDNNLFPSTNFVSTLKNILNKNYNIKIKSKKIINRIMKNKYKENWNNIIIYFFKRYQNNTK